MRKNMKGMRVSFVLFFMLIVNVSWLSRPVFSIAGNPQNPHVTSAGASNDGVFESTHAGVESSTTLTSGPNPSTCGQSVTFTATVNPSTATGTMIFKQGATKLATQACPPGAQPTARHRLAPGPTQLPPYTRETARTAARPPGCYTAGRPPTVEFVDRRRPVWRPHHLSCHKPCKSEDRLCGGRLAYLRAPMEERAGVPWA